MTQTALSLPFLLLYCLIFGKYGKLGGERCSYARCDSYFDKQQEI
jgi:hypothetical protein